MSEIDRLLQAFDAEIEQLTRTPGGASQSFLDTTAKRMRDGLRMFYVDHKRPPYTVGELLNSEFSIPKFRGFLNVQTGPFPGKLEMDRDIELFLHETQRDSDGRGHASQGTVWALRLVHAVYRAHNPISRWKASANILTKRGFTDDQIRAIQNDRQVRKAVRLLLRPYHH